MARITLGRVESTYDVGDHELSVTPTFPVLWLLPAVCARSEAGTKTVHWKIPLGVKFCETNAT